MLYYDVLDEIAAASYIPNENHEWLHVNPRESWIELMIYLIESGYIKNSYEELCVMAENWESVLYRRFSALN